MTALRAIHAGVRQLRLDDDLKRALYAQVTGKASAADMTEAERQAVVQELRKRGFKSVSKSRKTLTGPYAKKLQALWIAAWNLGLVRNRDDAALLAFVKRQTGIDHTRFLHHADDAAKAIEALKAWLARDGGVDWTHDRLLPDWALTNGYRIAAAQEGRLRSAGEACRLVEECGRALGGTTTRSRCSNSVFDSMSDRDWITVMNELGWRIRAVGEAS